MHASCLLAALLLVLSTCDARLFVTPWSVWSDKAPESVTGLLSFTLEVGVNGTIDTETAVRKMTWDKECGFAHVQKWSISEEYETPQYLHVTLKCTRVDGNEVKRYSTFPDTSHAEAIRADARERQLDTWQVDVGSLSAGLNLTGAQLTVCGEKDERYVWNGTTLGCVPSPGSAVAAVLPTSNTEMEPVRDAVSHMVLTTVAQPAAVFVALSLLDPVTGSAVRLDAADIRGAVGNFLSTGLSDAYLLGYNDAFFYLPIVDDAIGTTPTPDSIRIDMLLLVCTGADKCGGTTTLSEIGLYMTSACSVRPPSRECTCAEGSFRTDAMCDVCDFPAFTFDSEGQRCRPNTAINVTHPCGEWGDITNVDRIAETFSCRCRGFASGTACETCDTNTYSAPNCTCPDGLDGVGCSRCTYPLIPRNTRASDVTGCVHPADVCVGLESVDADASWANAACVGSGKRWSAGDVAWTEHPLTRCVDDRPEDVPVMLDTARCVNTTVPVQAMNKDADGVLLPPCAIALHPVPSLLPTAGWVWTWDWDYGFVGEQRSSCQPASLPCPENSTRTDDGACTQCSVWCPSLTLGGKAYCSQGNPIACDTCGLHTPTSDPEHPCNMTECVAGAVLLGRTCLPCPTAAINDNCVCVADPSTGETRITPLAGSGAEDTTLPDCSGCASGAVEIDGACVGCGVDGCLVCSAEDGTPCEWETGFQIREIPWSCMTGRFLNTSAWHAVSCDPCPCPERSECDPISGACITCGNGAIPPTCTTCPLGTTVRYGTAGDPFPSCVPCADGCKLCSHTSPVSLPPTCLCEAMRRRQLNRTHCSHMCTDDFVGSDCSIPFGLPGAFSPGCPLINGTCIDGVPVCPTFTTDINGTCVACASLDHAAFNTATCARCEPSCGPGSVCKPDGTCTVHRDGIDAGRFVTPTNMTMFYVVMVTTMTMVGILLARELHNAIQ